MNFSINQDFYTDLKNALKAGFKDGDAVQTTNKIGGLNDVGVVVGLLISGAKWSGDQLVVEYHYRVRFENAGTIYCKPDEITALERGRHERY